MRTVFLLIPATAFAALFVESADVNAGNWLQWRGPSRNNVAATGQSIPSDWSQTKNVVWNVEVPGRGHSSPIVVDDLVVLTSADEGGEQQGVFAFDRSSGKQKWATVVSKGGFPKKHIKNTHASATPCSDGKHIFATFCHHDKVEAIALDLAGKILWQEDVGGFRPKQYEYGYASSPTIHGEKLIVCGDTDTGAWLKSLDLQNGDVVWEQQRPEKLNWGSPIVGEVAGREQLLIGGCDLLASYDPETGKPLWQTPCLTMATGGTVIWDDENVYASGGFPKKETVAVKGDGSGEVIWRNGVKCYEQSMLIYDGYVYAVDDGGVAYCWEAKSGREMWKQRLQGPVSASPVLIGDSIYASNERGVTFVFRATPEKFEPLGRNQLGTESFASPTVVDNIIYLRAAMGEGASRKEGLFAIGKSPR